MHIDVTAACKGWYNCMKLFRQGPTMLSIRYQSQRCHEVSQNRSWWRWQCIWFSSFKSLIWTCIALTVNYILCFLNPFLWKLHEPSFSNWVVALIWRSTFFWRSLIHTNLVARTKTKTQGQGLLLRCPWQLCRNIECRRIFISELIRALPPPPHLKKS